MLRKASLSVPMLLIAIGSHCGTVSAQSYPSRPIRLVLPYPAGTSSNDVLGRALAQRLGEPLGQTIVFDNRPGASGTIGTEGVAKAPPDGHTLLVGVTGPMAIAPSVYPKLGYDPVRDFAPVAMIALVPYMIVMHPSLPAKNVKEFVALAKAHPRKIIFASTGTGGTPHLCIELLQMTTGIEMLHVPYKGGSPAIVDTIAGHTQVYGSSVTNGAPFVRQGRLRALGVTILRRSPVLPDVPTLDEQGLRGFEVVQWTGVFAPAKTPRPIVDRLGQEITRLVNTPEFAAVIQQHGNEPAPMTPDELGGYLRREIDKWAKVVKATGVKVD